MLAERKKKMKWTLNPRGNSWSKDTNKFGQRMLEKMGWKCGEGLGVNKQGITEHIKVAYKNDNKCLGYKDSGEEWVEHQSQFESLLAELSSSHSTATSLDSDKDKVSQTETLEQRSRHSRTRVHYQKFTRGKDLSRYSEKDLKCILLGKQKANSADEENEDNDGNEYFNGFYGIKTINSGSMNAYFKKLTNSENYSNTCSSDVHFGEVEVSKQNNHVGEQCDVKVKKKKKRKAEVQMSDTENRNMDSNETSSTKQQKKRKKCKALEHSDSTNDDQPYTYYENGSVFESKHQGQDVIDPEDIITNGICNEELYCDEICKEKKPKIRENCSIQDRKYEVIETDDEIQDKQVKKKPKKKNSELVKEDEKTSVVPVEDISSKSENSKAVLEHLIAKVDDEIEVGQAKKKSRKKHPLSPSEELVPLECVSCDSKNTEDTELCLTDELDKVEGKQRKKKCKKKTREFTDDYRETSVMPAEDVTHMLKNSKDTKDHLSVEVEGEQFKKKSKKKKHELPSDSVEIPVLPAEDVSYRLENSKDKEETVEVADVIKGKQLKKKSKKKKYELLCKGGGASVVPVEDILLVFENSENTVVHLKGKDKEKLTKGIRDVHISPENNRTAADIDRLDHGVSNDNEVGSNEQIAEDVNPIKRKQKNNIKMDDVENLVAEDISVEKKRHKRKKDEVVRQSKQIEPVIEEGKETNTDKELQSVANSINGSSKSIVNENIPEKLNKGCLESLTKSHEGYSVDEIKNMKSSLFAQLVDPRLVEFKGSNLHTIAGYGK